MYYLIITKCILKVWWLHSYIKNNLLNSLSLWNENHGLWAFKTQLQVIVLAPALLSCYSQHTGLICWSGAPEVDSRPATVLTGYLVSSISLPTHHIPVGGWGPWHTHQRGSCLALFVTLFPLPRPLWYRNHLLCPFSSLDNSCLASCPSPRVSSSPTWLNAF